jgi:hypothetical protein
MQLAGLGGPVAWEQKPQTSAQHDMQLCTTNNKQGTEPSYVAAQTAHTCRAGAPMHAAGRPRRTGSLGTETPDLGTA